jgi:uncharacterized protein (TIGR03086 family)
VVADLLAVLAEPNRRRLLELLSTGEKTAGELAASFAVSRPAISQHLGILVGAGLIEARQQGRFRHYRLVPEGMAALRAALDAFWTDELAQLATARPPVRRRPTRREKGPAMAEKSVVVPLGAEETFELLTDPERLRRWQAVTARVDLRAGGEYRFTVIPGHTAAGTFTEVEPGRRIVYTWGWEGQGDLPPGASTVTITLEPAEGGTRVILVHEGLTDEQAAGHAEGWQHYFERLILAATDGDAGTDAWVTGVEALDRLSSAEASLAACQSVLRAMPPGAGDLPTVCRQFTVDQLIAHLLGSLTFLGGAIGGTIVAPVGGSAESRVADVAQQALEAWRRHGLDGTVTMRGREGPAQRAANLLSIELLVHAWDLAQATSQEVAASEALGDYVLGLAQEMITPETRDGDSFAQQVETGPDAGALERLAAYTGRAV